MITKTHHTGNLQNVPL